MLYFLKIRFIKKRKIIIGDFCFLLKISEIPFDIKEIFKNIWCNLIVIQESRNFSLGVRKSRKMFLKFPSS